MDTIRLVAPAPVGSNRATLANRRLHEELWDELVQLASGDLDDEDSVLSARCAAPSPRPGRR